MNKSYQRWMRICTDCGYILAAVLAVWAIPLLHQSGPLALLPYAGIVGMVWSAATAAGLAVIWFRHEWESSRLRARLTALVRRPAWRESEA